MNLKATHAIAGVSYPILCALTVLMWVDRTHADVSPPVIRQFQPPDTNGAVLLRWDATPGSAYVVQMTTDLLAGAWAPLDLLVATSNSLTWQANGQGGTAGYYRLATEAIGIMSVEPGFIPTNTPVTIYITGQGFDESDVVTATGPAGTLALTNRVILSPTLIAVSLPAFRPDLAGDYQLQVTSGSGRSAQFSYAWSLVSRPQGSLSLLEPPRPSPANPSAAPRVPALMRAREKASRAVALMKAKEKANQTVAMPALMKAREKASRTVTMPSLMRAREKAARTVVVPSPSGGGDGVFAMKAKEKACRTRTMAADAIDIEDYSSGPELPSVIGSQAGGSGGNGSTGGAGVGGRAGGGETDVDCGGAAGGVMLFSGDVQLQEVDLVIPGRGLNLVWARTYRARASTHAGMSYSWTVSYDVSVSQSSTGIAVNDGTGRSDVYLPGPSGVYSRPGFFNEGTLSNGVFTLTFPDTGKWVFNAFDGTATAGKLAQIVDRNGNTIALAYDGSGRLAQIVDDLGRTNTVAYNSGGQLASITDFSGRTVTYAYYAGEPGGSVGDLKSVTSPPVTGTPNGNDFPSGKTTTYTYSSGFSNEAENHLLLSVTDAKGQTASQFVYQHNSASFDYLRCLSAQEGTNDPIYFTYTSQVASPTNQYATCEVIVRDALGNVTQTLFNSRNLPVDLKEYTGRAPTVGPVTESSNRPINPVRTTDPAYYETQWTWNQNALCVQETEPRGNSVRYVYETDYNPSARPRKQGDVRAVHVGDLNGDGVPDLVTRYEYDPRFGSSARDYCVQYRESDFAGGEEIFTDKYSRIKVQFHWDRQGKENPLVLEGYMTPSRKGLMQVSRPRMRGRLKWANITAVIGGSAGGMNQTGLPIKLGTANGGVEQGGTSVLWRRRKKNHDTSKDAVAAGDRVPAGDVSGDGRNDFVVTRTDPNGNVMTATYDANGNCVEARAIAVSSCGGNKPTIDAAYNSYGQIIGVTNVADGNCYRSVDTFSYYNTGAQAGYIQSATCDAGGLSLIWNFEHDARGNLTRCIDPRTNDWLYVYNALDQLMQSSSASLGGGSGGPSYRITTQFAYDANDNLVRVDEENRDFTGTLNSSNPQWSTLYQYDVLNRCVQVQQKRDASYYVTSQYQYDANGNLTLFRSPEAVNGNDPNRVVQYAYDERNLPFQSISAPGTASAAACQWNYDRNDNLSQTVDEANAVTSYSYDDFDRCVTVQDAMGNVASYSYDANGNLTQARIDGEITDVPGSAGNQLLARITYRYDALDRLVQASSSRLTLPSLTPLGSGVATTTYTYAANDDCLSATDDNGHTTRYAYDTAGRLATLTDPKTNTIAYACDPNGNVLSTTYTDNSDLGGKPQQFVITAQYDALDRCTSSADNVGNTETYAYDSRDNLVRCTDAKGQLAGWTYDGLRRCTVAIADLDRDGVLDFALDAGSLATYDDNGCVVSTTDANTNTTAYAYDALDRCVLQTSPNGTRHTFVWDSRSELASSTDANNTTVTNTYDLCGRIIHRDIAARNFVATTTTFETFAYDGCSRLVLASNDVSRLTFGYDTLGDCTSSTQDGLTTTYTYDGVGNCLSMTYPAGRVVSYTYDGLDQVASVSTSASGGLPPTSLATYAYDGLGRLARILRNNSVNTRIFWDGLVSPANTTGDFGFQQVARMNHAVAGGVTIIDHRAFTYDAEQNKTSRGQVTEFVIGQGTLTNQWTYDALNRMSSALNTKGTTIVTQVYSLDAVGNRLSVASNGVVQTYTRGSANPPGDFQMDRYTTTPFGSEQYDTNGDLVQVSGSAGQAQYTYDYAGRIVQAVVIDSSTGVLVTNEVSFSYDALGNRLSKTVTTASQPPVTTYWVRSLAFERGEAHRPYMMIESRAGGPSGSVSNVWCWGNGSRAYGDINRDGYPDVVVAFTGAGAVNYYPLSDDLGNVLALTDGSGNVLERYEYGDFGGPRFLTSDGTPSSSTSSAYGNTFLFHSMEWDVETALYYCGSEELPKESYFDFATGRYLLKAGVPMTFGRNAYTFGGDNPWSRVKWTRDSLKGSTKTQGEFSAAPATQTETLVFRPTRGDVK